MGVWYCKVAIARQVVDKMGEETDQFINKLIAVLLRMPLVHILGNFLWKPKIESLHNLSDSPLLTSNGLVSSL